MPFDAGKKNEREKKVMRPLLIHHVKSKTEEKRLGKKHVKSGMHYINTAISAREARNVVGTKA
jgi:hypothetical protein